MPFTQNTPPHIHATMRLFAEFKSAAILSKTPINSATLDYIQAL